MFIQIAIAKLQQELKDLQRAISAFEDLIERRIASEIATEKPRTTVRRGVNGWLNRRSAKGSAG